MGFLSKIVDPVIGGLGFGGGAGEARQYQSDPAAYQELYEKAVAEINNAYSDKASRDQRDSINKILQSQLGGLEDNAAARKEDFLQNQTRSFGADVQNIARARGGTGTLQQALAPNGAMYDAKARATATGLNDLYSQATKDLSSLQGVQGNLYGQDMGKATALANLYQNELGSRRGTSTQNLENQWNAQQAMYGRLADTAKAGASAIAGAPNTGQQRSPQIQRNSPAYEAQERKQLGSMW